MPKDFLQCALLPSQDLSEKGIFLAQSYFICVIGNASSAILQKVTKLGDLSEILKNILPLRLSDFSIQ